MERWILALCHERLEPADFQEEWKKEGISVRMISDAGEAAGELSGNTDYLLIIIFFRGEGAFILIKDDKGAEKSPHPDSKPAV